MIKKRFIPEFYFEEDDLDHRDTKNLAQFAIAPYIDDLRANKGNDGDRSFNTFHFIETERVFTEKMLTRVSELLDEVTRMIIYKKADASVEFENIPEQFRRGAVEGSKHPLEVLLENYSQQLVAIDKLNKMFGFTKTKIVEFIKENQS